jgi:hypothetical protein
VRLTARVSLQKEVWSKSGHGERVRAASDAGVVQFLHKQGWVARSHRSATAASIGEQWTWASCLSLNKPPGDLAVAKTVIPVRAKPRRWRIRFRCQCR